MKVVSGQESSIFELPAQVMGISLSKKDPQCPSHSSPRKETSDERVEGRVAKRRTLLSKIAASERVELIISIPIRTPSVQQGKPIKLRVRSQMPNQRE